MNIGLDYMPVTFSWGGGGGGWETFQIEKKEIATLWEEHVLNFI